MLMRPSISIPILLACIQQLYAQTNFTQSNVTLKEPAGNHFQAIYNDELYIVSSAPNSTRIEFPFKKGDEWKTSPIITDGQSYRFEVYLDGSVQVNDKLYFTEQDANNVDYYLVIFSLSSNNFTKSSPKEYYAKCVTYSSLTNLIYAIGGTSSCTNRFDVSTGNWLTDGADPTDFRMRHGCCMNPDGDGSYVFGGQKPSQSQTYSTIERYDVVNDVWYPVNATLSVPRNYAVCRLMSSLIYCMGGRTMGNTRIVNMVEIFDPITEEMQTSPTLALTQVNHWFAASVWDDRCIVVTGGLKQGGGLIYDTIETFGDCNTLSPTEYPTNDPTVDPSYNPTKDPTFVPSADPTVDPTNVPTIEPTLFPSTNPTLLPSVNPSVGPFINPTFDPSAEPSEHPSNMPTTEPSKSPLETSKPSLPETKDKDTNEDISSNESNTILTVSIIFVLVVCLLIVIIAVLIGRLRQKDKLVNQMQMNEVVNTKNVQMSQTTANTQQPDEETNI